MYLQKRPDLEQTISQLEADKAKLQEQMRSATVRYKASERRCGLAESKLSELECSTEDLGLRYSSLQESHDALTTQMEKMQEKSTAATERAAAMESQLSDMKVTGICGSHPYFCSIINC